MKSLLILFDQAVSLYIWILIINAIISWLVAFNILNTGNRLVYSILEISYKLTSPPLNYIRKFQPLESTRSSKRDPGMISTDIHILTNRSKFIMEN